MNIIDVVLVLIILCAGIVGFKRGVFKELVMTVGFFLVFIISFKLKDPIAEWLSFNLPFFTFKGMTVLNIILYQVIAFLIIFSIIMVIFRVVLSVTGIFEKILKFTIILGIPSKIAGFIVGLIEGYIVMFVVIFILSQPFLDVGIMDNSKYADRVLNSSPVLTSVVSKTNDAIKEIYVLEKDYSETKNKSVFNNETIRIILKYGIVNEDYIIKLKDIGKLKY